MLNFDRLIKPSTDGDILVEPAAGHWLGLIQGNMQQPGHQSVRLAGVSVDQLRQATRSALLGSQCAQPVIACGHQPAFVHPGVWAKHVVVHHIARRLGAVGIDFVVDNDTPHSFALEVPAINADGLLGISKIALNNLPPGSAHEGHPPLDRSALEAISQELSAALGEKFSESMIATYMQGRAEAVHAPDTVEQHLAGRVKIDASLSADLREIRVSKAFGGFFVADLLLNAPRFADAYNESLAEYRRQQHVRGSHRPLPDLGRKEGRVETALWVYQPLKQRRRLWVARQGEKIDCYADNELVGTLAANDLTREPDAALASLEPWLVRPRALTLTLWARLLICDLFVHGIGGAKYDRITDGIFRRYYQCAPPAFVCVSATLQLPLPRRASTPDELAAARRHLRDFSCKPQRYLPDPPPELLDERSRLIHNSDNLRQTRGSSAERKKTFVDIRRINARLAETGPDIQQGLSRRLERLVREVESNRIADSREFFYALQSRPRLAALAQRLVETAEAGELPT